MHVISVASCNATSCINQLLKGDKLGLPWQSGG